VILAATGPVVIDWTNARSGDPALDVALTWVIGATSGFGGSFLDHFLSHFEERELLRALPAASKYRMADANVTDSEREAVRHLVREADFRAL
jgi:aminoglycoside phosphotransferase (APT) family kinase protein